MFGKIMEFLNNPWMLGIIGLLLGVGLYLLTYFKVLDFPLNFLP